MHIHIFIPTAILGEMHAFKARDPRVDDVYHIYVFFIRMYTYLSDNQVLVYIFLYVYVYIHSHIRRDACF
jgi:hypothetical protein